MEQLDFLVKGSSSDAYEVTFIKDGESLTALCTCPAGQFGGPCKHRIAILDGNSDGVTSDNAEKVVTVTEWLEGSDVQAAITELRNAEKTGNASKADLSALKRKLGRAMNT